MIYSKLEKFTIFTNDIITKLRDCDIFGCWRYIADICNSDIYIYIYIYIYIGNSVVIRTLNRGQQLTTYLPLLECEGCLFNPIEWGANTTPPP
jgi:hypothetical protein